MKKGRSGSECWEEMKNDGRKRKDEMIERKKKGEKELNRKERRK